MGVFACLLAAFLIAAAPVPPRLEGEWVLVEQTYGRGQANLADTDEPLRLELYRDTNELRGRMWRGDQRSQRRDWPAVVADDRTLPVEVTSRREDPTARSAEVRYRVRPADDGLILEVLETYRIEPGTDQLVGRVEVTFRLGGDERGSYVLHRRFERAP
jgi:hypothetical protein